MSGSQANEAPDTPAEPAVQSRSTAIAADPTLVELWRRDVPFPAFDQMPDLDVVTHVNVERAAAGGFHYLHETTLAWHDGTLFMAWANGKTGEVNVEGEVIRGRTSRDGVAWSDVEVWASPPMLDAQCINQPALVSHGGSLWGFFTCFRDGAARTEVFRRDTSTGRWQPCGAAPIPDFMPFTPPRPMRDGNWIMAGNQTWYEAAVAISRGDDFTRWDLVRIARPDALFVKFPETALLDLGDELLAICRPFKMPTALVSRSSDCGRTWSPLTPSNFPVADSQPFAGTLSTGRHYLITNNLDEGRALLSIAVTAPGERTFSRIWKVRHQRCPKRRLFAGVFWKGKLVKPMVGTATEWSYPAAVEHEGNLYVSYTQGKEDANVSIIPLRALR